MLTVTLLVKLSLSLDVYNSSQHIARDMSATPISGTDCCNSCNDEVATQVPGPAGPAGTPGTNGTNGISPFTTITDGFTVPSVGLTATFNVADSQWMVVGQIVYVAGIGYFQVTELPSTTQVKILFPAWAVDFNVAPGTNVPATTGMVTAGVQGPEGDPGIPPTLNELSPTTTKGDIIVDNGANNPLASDVRLAAGTDGRVLHARSGQPTGLQWSDIDLTGVLSAISGALPIANGGTGNTTRQAAINALLDKPGSTAGDMLYYNGTNYLRLPIGTALQGLRTNAGATAPEWATTAGVLQMVSASTAAYSTSVAAIPYDDTIPTSSEGDSYLAASISATSTTTRLIITVHVPFVLSGAATFIASLIKSGTAPALSASAVTMGSGATGILAFQHVVVPGSTSSFTYTVRIGVTGGATAYLNGDSGGRQFGGVQRAWITIVEYV